LRLTAWDKTATTVLTKVCLPLHMRCVLDLYVVLRC